MIQRSPIIDDTQHAHDLNLLSIVSFILKDETLNITKSERNLCGVHLSKDENSVIITDQRLLPSEEKLLSINKPEEMYDAIKTLAVRGAPAIGIFAAYSVYVLAKHYANGDIYNTTTDIQKTKESDNITEGKQKWLSVHSTYIKTQKTSGVEHNCIMIPHNTDYKNNSSDLLNYLKIVGDYLVSSRPTAVNLSWAVKRMISAANSTTENTTDDIISHLKNEAIIIHNEDILMCKRISEYGLSLIKDGDGVLTHCNAGPLATSRYGTALGPILLAKERGINIRVFADETRPLLQGARLTAYELDRAGVDVTLICDNMASLVMKSKMVNACFVGCDRIAANGDFANKIGTSGVAILAKYYGIPFYTLGPSSTVDMNCPTGEDIEIELRDGDEIKNLWYKKPMAPDKVKCYNPAFDVTDHSLVTAIVTDRGIVYPPFDKGLKELFDENKE